MTITRLATAVTDFWALRPEVKVTLLQTALVAIAGAWAFRLYRQRREGRSSMRLSGAYRVERHSDHRLLFLRLDFANNGAVMVRHLQAAVTVLVPAIDPTDGRVSLHALRSGDPLNSVAGKPEPGRGEPVAPVLLEVGPRERIQTELVVRLPLDAGPVAVRLTAMGAQGRWIFRSVPWWAWFAYVHPSQDNAEYVPLSITNRD